MAVVSHKYMPEHMPEEELKHTFAARQHTLDYLVKCLRDQIGAQTLTSYLITGPRGAGKTTLILMLCSRLKEDPKLRATWLPVRFPEELLTVASLRDLLATALDILADAGIPGAHEWCERVEQEMDEAASQDLAVAGLRQVAQSQNKRLILCVENLDFVFKRGLTDETKATFRRLLMTDPFMMIVGSAVRTFPELQSYDEAFFNYFCPIDLERLSEKQAHEVLTRRAEWDRNDLFEARYRKHRAKIRAISLLTGGNPRLLLMLYEILTERELGSVVLTLRGLVDELTPVLKDILEHQLTEQQVKIVDALMQLDGKAKPSELAQKSRLSLNTVTTQLKRLEEAHLVELHGGGKGRPAWYTIPDRLFYTWYQMRYLRPQRRRIEMFVEVLQVWFEAEERFAALQSLVHVTTTERPERARSLAETAEYFAASLTATTYERSAREIAISTWLRMGDIGEAVGAYVEFQGIGGGTENTAAYMDLGKRLLDHGYPHHAVQVLKERAEHEPHNVDLQYGCGVALAMSGEYPGAYLHFDRALKSPHASIPVIALVLLNRGLIKDQQDDIAGAMADYTSVIELDGAPAESVAKALLNRGVAKVAQRETAGAVADYTAIIKLKGAPAELVAAALVNRGATKAEQGDTAGAIADYTAVIKLKGASEEEVAMALFNRGVTKGEQGETAGAIADYTAVIELKGAIAGQVAQSLVNRGLTKDQQGDTAGAIADYTAVIKLKGAPADQVAKASVLRGVTKSKQGDTAGAIADYSVVVELEGAPIEIRLDAAAFVLQEACQKDRQMTDLMLSAVKEALDGLSEEERTRHLLAFFAQLADLGKRDAWLYAFRVLTKDQAEEVTRQVEPLPVVAEVLESGDMSELDPLPPEQRDFALEVLRKFEPGHSAWIRS